MCIFKILFSITILLNSIGNTAYKLNKILFIYDPKLFSPKNEDLKKD